MVTQLWFYCGFIHNWVIIGFHPHMGQKIWACVVFLWQTRLGKFLIAKTWALLCSSKPWGRSFLVGTWCSINGSDKSVTKCKDPKRQTDKASCNLPPPPQTNLGWNLGGGGGGGGTNCIKWVFKFLLQFQREEHLAHWTGQ
jgi:hypothetical protein